MKVQTADPVLCWEDREHPYNQPLEESRERNRIKQRKGLNCDAALQEASVDSARSSEDRMILQSYAELGQRG